MIIVAALLYSVTKSIQTSINCLNTTYLWPLQLRGARGVWNVQFTYFYLRVFGWLYITLKTAWSRPAEKGLFPVLHDCSRLHRGHNCKHCHACQRASQKPQSHCVRTVQQKCPEPAGGTCQALRRRRTPHFLSLPQGGQKEWELSLLVLSCCCSTKSKVLLHKKPTGWQRRRACGEGRRPPRLCSVSFSGKKLRAQHVLLLMPRWLPRALRGAWSGDVHSTCSLQTRGEASKWEGGEGSRLLGAWFSCFLLWLLLSNGLNGRDKYVFTLSERESCKEDTRGGMGEAKEQCPFFSSLQCGNLGGKGAKRTSDKSGH